MAKIIIEAADADDLRTTMEALFGYLGDPEKAEASDADPTPRRGGRKGRSAATATALETGNAANAGAGLDTSASAGTASGASQASSASSPEASGQSQAVTAEAVKVAMTKAMEATSPLIAQKALSDAGLPVRMSELTADQYPKALEVLNGLAASV